MDTNNNIMLPGLFGSYISRSKAVGYCYFHKAHLTAKMMKTKGCLGKCCECLKKHEENDHWRQRRVIKERKKANKLQIGVH